MCFHYNSESGLSAPQRSHQPCSSSPFLGLVSSSVKRAAGFQAEMQSDASHSWRTKRSQKTSLCVTLLPFVGTFVLESCRDVTLTVSPANRGVRLSRDLFIDCMDVDVHSTLWRLQVLQVCSTIQLQKLLCSMWSKSQRRVTVLDF